MNPTVTPPPKAPSPLDQAASETIDTTHKPDGSNYTLDLPQSSVPAPRHRFPIHPAVGRATKKALIAAGVLTATVALLVGAAFVLQRRSSSDQPSARLSGLSDQDVRLARPVDELPPSELDVRPGVSTLVVSGDISVSEQLRLSPTELPDSAALGTILVDKATNTLQFYDGTKFTPLGATLIQIENQTGVTSIQGIQGDVKFVGTDGVAVSQVGGTITIGGGALALPQPLGTGSSPIFAGLNVSGGITQNGNAVCDASNNCGYGFGDVLQGGNSFGSAMTIGTNDAHTLNFETGGTTRMTVDGTTGNVGIGTTIPAARLEVQGLAGTPGLRIVRSDQPGYYLTISQVAGSPAVSTFRVNNSAALSLAANSSVRVGNYAGSVGLTTPTNSLVVSGNVGIGTSSPERELHVAGSALFHNVGDMTSAFRVERADGSSVLQVDTQNRRVYVGTTAGNTNGTVLVLNNHTSASDPSGINGALLYNSALGKFRCYEANVWKDCISAGGGMGTGDILQGGNSFGTAMTIGTNDGYGLNLEVGGTVVASLDALGAAIFRNSTNSSQAFAVQDSVGRPLLLVDSVQGVVRIGPSGGNPDGFRLTLGRRTQAGDPAGLAGAMYYNTVAEKFRCYEANVWKDCISAGGGMGTGDILQGGNSFGTAMTIGTNDAQALNFETGGTTRMTIDATTGNVGIGTAPTNVRLRVNGGVLGSSAVYAEGPTGFVFGSSSALGKRIQHSGNDIEVVAGDAVRLHVDGDAGNIGINNTSPGNLLSINTPTTADAAAQVLISTGGTGNKGLVVQRVAGQSANLFELQSEGGTTVAGITYTGGGFFGTTSSLGARVTVQAPKDFLGLLLKGAANQVGDLLQLQNSSGAAIGGFNATGNLFIGTTTAPNKINVNTATTPDAAAQVLISTGGTSNKGLVVQGVAGQVANALEVQGGPGNLAFAVNGSGSVGISLAPGTGAARLAISTGTLPTVVGQIIRGASGQTADLYQLQSNTGTTLAGFNATGNLFIGTTTAPNRINVNTATTPDAAAQVLISTGGTSNKGLVLQGVAGQTGQVFQAQRSDGVASVWISTPDNMATNSPVLSVNSTAGQTYFSGYGNLTVHGGSANASVNVQAAATSSGALALHAKSGQTASLLQFRNSANAIMGGFNATGRLFMTDSDFAVTLNTATLTGNAVISLPNTNGVNDTFCLVVLANCGGGVGSGTGDINQGGNAFGQTMVIGTLDGYGVNLAIGGTTVMSFGTNGGVTFQNSTDTTYAFRVQRAGGATLFHVNSFSSRVYIGYWEPDSVGVVLVVDNKNTTGDPAGVNGGMYYNSTLGKFRCYQAGAWKNCDSDTLLATKTADQTVSGTSYADVADLAYPVVATGKYNLRCSLEVSVTGNGGYLSMTGPASPTRYTATFTKLTDQSSGETVASSSTYDDPSTALGFRVATTSLGSGRFIVNYDAKLINGANAGDWKLRARAESGSSITIYDYSNCSLRAF